MSEADVTQFLNYFPEVSASGIAHSLPRFVYISRSATLTMLKFNDPCASASLRTSRIYINAGQKCLPSNHTSTCSRWLRCIREWILFSTAVEMRAGNDLVGRSYGEKVWSLVACWAFGHRKPAFWYDANEYGENLASHGRGVCSGTLLVNLFISCALGTHTHRNLEQARSPLLWYICI